MTVGPGEVNQPLHKYRWLQEAIDGDTEIVTASRRLARELGSAYANQQIFDGRKAWLTPPIAFWQDWLSRKLASASDPAAVPRRLDVNSAAILWEQSLSRRMPDGLLGFAGIVRQAARAWQRLQDWNIPLPDVLSSARNEDERLFARAVADYQALLERSNWADSANLAAAVGELVRTDSAVVPDRLMLCGFDRLSPSVEEMIATLEQAGCAVSVLPAAARSASVTVASFEQEAAEMRAAGAWARGRLDEFPNARVAIVCPGLEVKADEVARLVREGLVPGWQYGGRQHRSAANVSYGRRLSEYPAIAVALLLLRWLQSGLTGREISVLLRSRSIGPGLTSGRSRFELMLRQHPDREWPASELLKVIANGEDSPDTLVFADAVKEVIALAEDADSPAGPSAWAGRLDSFLNAVGWPGEAPLDSAGFQLINRWRELLNEFARIEMVVPAISLSEAVSRIASLAGETVWQPEGAPGAVEILGALEAAGMEFDCIWVAGMDASQWPPPSRPSPFISHSLQREHRMPDATPGDTLKFSKRVLGRLIGSADQCVLSWSRTREDAELTVSTLVDGLGAKDYEGPGDPGWSALPLVGSGEFDPLLSDAAPPVSVDEKVAGGAYTVQRQFTEPFSAFVTGRLGVRPPDPFWTGLSPSVRGNIIHQALHNLFADKPSREDIQKWSEPERGRRIGSAVDAALGRHLRYANEVIGRVIGLERRRLRRLLDEFIDAESRRDTFEVADLEAQVEYERFGVRLGFRVDRIDRLADGRLLIIDYKSGQPKTFVRQDGELKDVQLVVYADALQGDIGGLLFINVDSRDIGYRGKGAGWDGSDEEEWAQMLAGWQAEVHDAVEALAKGDVRINLMQTPGEGRALAILSRLEEQKRVE